MRPAPLVLALLAAAAARLPAQQPTVSSALQRLAAQDTVVAVWFFGRPEYALDAVAASVRQAGGRVRRSSRWLHAVSADLPTSALGAARAVPAFRHIQPLVRVRGRPEDDVPATGLMAAPGAGSAVDSLYGAAAMPLRQLGLLPLAARNLRGAGVKIAIFDTGFETGEPAFASTLLLGQRDFVFGDSIVANEPEDAPTASRHGTEVWSLLGANVPGTIIGIAPDAGYILAKTEDIRSETRVEEDNWVAALEWADSLGATVVSSSVGYVDFDDGFTYRPQDFNGDVAVTTVAADSAAARGITVVNAAGNNGPTFRSLITPADGHTVLAAGAEDSLGALAAFSSRGPTADGRLKPDFTAPGVGVFVVNPFTTGGFSRVNGTSFAAPLLAGTAALLRQLHPMFGPDEVRAALRMHASRTLSPDSSVGWGRPQGALSAFFPRGILLTGPSDSILPSVTPTLSWTVPDVPPVAIPVRYHVVVAADTQFTAVVLDTVVLDEAITIADPQRPGTRLAYMVTVETSDSVAATSAASPWYATPAWATLLQPDGPGGITVRDPRPTFTWTSPTVTVPPGPFTYDVRLVRVDDGSVELEATELTATEFTPAHDLERNTPYRWSVTSWLGADSVVTESRGTFVIVDDSAPLTTLLYQNFPNPFPNRDLGRDATCMWFDLATEGRVRLDVLDARGHIVRDFVPGSEFGSQLPAGRYGRPDGDPGGSCDPRLEWDGTATDGRVLPQGIYLVRLVTPDGTFTKRIVFMGREF